MRGAFAIALALTLGVATLSPRPAQAQLSGQHLVTRHLAKGVAQTKVGDWVTYKLVGGSDRRTWFCRAAVVGEEKDRKGRDAVWVEVDIGTHHAMKAPLVQVKMLLARDALSQREPVTRMYLAWGVEKARELDDASLKRLFSGTSPATAAEPITPADSAVARKYESTVRALPEQRLMTLAGTVGAVPVELRVRSTLIKRFYVSNEIPLLQLAKLEIPGIGHSLEVRDFGRNARPLMVIPTEDAPRWNLDQLPESILVPSRDMMSLVTGGKTP